MHQSTDQLPQHLLARAVESGGEFGWRKEEFLVALHGAASEGFACVGGQFQWALPDGTCEPYWLDAESTPRALGESWPSYVKRTEAEVEKGYELLLHAIDFNAEADKWDFLREKREKGVSLEEYLIFVAYFKGEITDR